MNLPNALTISRLLIAPFVVAMVIADTDGSVPAAALFALASATDWLDGQLARAHGTVSRFGTIVDPVADKALVLPALIALVWIDRLAAWAAVAIVARELGVSVLRLVAGRRGTLIPASSFGKAKMAAQVATVIVLIAIPDPHAGWVLGLVYGTVLVTIASGIDYLVSYRRAERGYAAAAPPAALLEPSSQRSRP